MASFTETYKTPIKVIGIIIALIAGLYALYWAWFFTAPILVGGEYAWIALIFLGGYAIINAVVAVIAFYIVYRLFRW